MKRIEAVKKAKELVARMTLEERATQLSYISPAIKRLGIPAYNWWNEALHGVARAGTATMFPQAIAMAATFDEDLITQVADVIATEGRAKYNQYSKHDDRDIYKGLTFWSPNVNIFRDPRWGRGHETYGEDPFLSMKLGTAFVKGLQGDGETMKAAACVKHFAVHSGPEAIRHEFNAIVSKKDLYETYLPAFEAVVKEGKVEGVMGAYNRTNGEPCCGSKTLIQDILRGDWEFDGYFVSDCWALRDFHEHHMVTNTIEESAAMALKAGCDLNCGNTYLFLLKAYQDGLVTSEEISRAAERLYTTRFMLGLFDGSEFDKIEYEKVECEEHLLLAEKVAEKSVVLLKNNGILPLKKEILRTVGVIGPNANSRAALIGNYHGTSSEYITMLEGIKQEAGENIRVFYSEGCHLHQNKVENLALEQDRIKEAIIVAEHSDVVILCLGLDETLEGEEGDIGNSYASGDKEDLLLPYAQQQLLEAVINVGKPTILCLLAGSSIDISYADLHADAIVQAWYPGARGGKTVAEILFGKKAPSGKLPVTFYKNLDEFPDFENYSMENRTYRYMQKEALYPFGYGLTYSKVRVTEVKVTKGFATGVSWKCSQESSSECPDKKEQINVIMDGTEDITENGIKVTASLHNMENRDTEEVLQIYIKNQESVYAVKNHSLCGFQRTFIKAGEEKKVTIFIPKESFMVVNEEGKKIFDGNHYILYVGISQPDSRSCSLLQDKPVELEIKFI